MWWRLVVLVLLVSMAAVILKAQHNRTWVHDIPTRKLHTEFASLRTGDIILFRNKRASLAHDLVSPFTHIGMVVVHGDKKLTLETHAPGDTKALGVDRGGVNMYDLNRRLETYQGMMYVLKARPGLINRGAQAILKRNIAKYMTIPYDDGAIAHIGMYCLPKRVCNVCFKAQERTRMFCSEFLGLVLQDMGILPPHLEIGCLTPTSFVNLTQNGTRLFPTLYKVVV